MGAKELRSRVSDPGGVTDQTNRVACHVHNPWQPRLLREAEAIGPSTIALVERILAAKPHPEQGFRACLGILRNGLDRA